LATSTEPDGGGDREMFVESEPPKQFAQIGEEKLVLFRLAVEARRLAAVASVEDPDRAASIATHEQLSGVRRRIDPQLECLPTVGAGL